MERKRERAGEREGERRQEGVKGILVMLLIISEKLVNFLTTFKFMFFQ